MEYVDFDNEKIRVDWDRAKNELVKKKRGISFHDAKRVISSEIGGGIKNDNPEQFYAVGFAAKEQLVTLIYEFRYDAQGMYLWFITLWKTTKEEKKRLNI